ncbi:Transcriptional regulator GlxA family, contains an amidase domain and an AraC-type DNA-binding HTH domain [Streptomyces sp. LcepLS]|nr:Transcriptional regulator GlxA family, contains an amidase domain and an AraC-type DNA-binding HTH domain [Streptomyces sp. TverLS-915]SCF07061.1 Transcriptional regulator GlxA family, contains an amidase domain and an AraC-type DNA-binding HTH domain [Streptomyces sp. LcepLS]
MAVGAAQYVRAMHTVAVLALDHVIPFDLSVPIETFGRTRLPDGRDAYRVVVCAPSPGEEVATGAFTLRAPYGLDALRTADTVVVPGTATPLAPLPAPVLEALREVAARGTRIASICTGAFPLAATGLLDGLRATTHWAAAALLAETYPAVEVDPDVLHVDNGQLLTSAGAAAGLDLCLHLVRRDYGSAVAADAARLSVMPLEREGGQAQFIVAPWPATPRGAELEPLLAWLEAHLDEEVTVERMARQAGTSTRTLIRHFKEQTGTTPLRWLHRARVRRGQHLLETTGYSVERIAGQVGFGSAGAFRERFKRTTGVSPQGYRRAFGGAGAA